MFPSDLAKKLFLSNTSPTPKEQSLLTLRFPKKLWKIVNECTSGAIAWSSDGSAVVIDYTKFQTDYLDNRLDIFKTTNITSFIRQLNLYGFRKVSPHYRVSIGNPNSADIHIFRNHSFIRGRPDLLQGVTRKTGALRSRMFHHKDEPSFMQSSPSSSMPHPVGIDPARIMQCQGRDFPPRHRQIALHHALSRQHDVLSRFDRHFTTDPSGKTSIPASIPLAESSSGGAVDLMHGLTWYCPDSTSETTSSEDEYEYKHGAYRPSKGANKLAKKIKKEPVQGALEAVEGEDGESLLPLAPKIPKWATAAGGDCGFGVGLNEGLFQHQHSRSGSPSPTLSASGDMGQLLDPSKSPKVALHQGQEGERDRTPPLEDSFMLESVLSRMDKSLSEKIYCILMTEDKKDDSVGMAKEITGSVGMAKEITDSVGMTHAAKAGPPAERLVDAVDNAAMASLLSTWDGDEATGSSQFNSCSASGSGDSTAPLYYA